MSMRITMITMPTKNGLIGVPVAMEIAKGESLLQKTESWST